MRCTICGKTDDPESYMKGNIRSIMEAKEVCFNCGFWEEKIAIHDDRTFIIKGERYHAQPDTSDIYKFKGFGGRKFKIRRIDTGEIIETQNLWYQGVIPPYFRDRMPDNAEFV